MNRHARSSYRIHGARLLDPANGLDAIGELAVRDGRIVHCGPTPATGDYDEVIDGSGAWLMPGVVDLCARLREPGHTQKARMASEAPAALAAGITALCMPPDTRPVIDDAAVLARVNRIAKAAAGAHVFVLGALTRGLAGESLAEMAALRQVGVVGVSNAGRPITDTLVLRRALEYAADLDLTVHLQAEDASLGAGGCAHEGPVALRLGLPTVPVAAETLALQRWLALAGDAGARLHVGRLSSARAVDLIAAAQAAGQPVTADVAAHQLFFTEDDLAGFDANFHLRPPPRSAADREALRQGVRSGVIGAICSDHQPHEPDAKIDPFPLTEPGISAIETLLPLALQLVEDGLLSPLQMVERLATQPARTLGVEGGSLAVGALADLALVDPQTPWTLEAESLRSAGRNTPLVGWRLPGRARRAWRAR